MDGLEAFDLPGNRASEKVKPVVDEPDVGRGSRVEGEAQGAIAKSPWNMVGDRLKDSRTAA